LVEEGVGGEAAFKLMVKLELPVVTLADVAARFNVGLRIESAEVCEGLMVVSRLCAR
jgi:hypothetical protein